MPAVTLDGSSQAILAKVASIQTFLNTTPASRFAPWFSIFAVLHATRIACAYRGAAKAVIQAALAPCILIFGGTTITGALMGIVPGWLISPIPVATYAIIPLIAAKSPIVPFILSLPALPRDLFFSFVDGFSRTFGITTLGVDSVLSHSHPGLRNSPWSMVLVATIAGGGGGLLVPAFRLFSPEWGFNATPPWVTHGPGIDVWGATVIGYVYATLIDAHPFFRLLPNYIYTLFPFLNSIVHLPKNYLSAAGSQPLLPNNEAKVACSLLLASMLMTKTLYPYFTALFKKSPKAKKSSGGSTAVAPVGKSTAIAPVSTNGAVKKNKDKPKKA